MASKSYLCKSKNIEPSRDCSKYKKQTLIFHPDKNLDCEEDARKKFQKLGQYCPSGQQEKTIKHTIKENPTMLLLEDMSNMKRDELLQSIIDKCNIDVDLILGDRQVENMLNIFKNMYMRYYYIKENIDDSDVDSNIQDALSINRNFKVFLEKTIPRKLKRIKDDNQICIYETILVIMGSLESDLNYILDNSLVGGKLKKRFSHKKKIKTKRFKKKKSRNNRFKNKKKSINKRFKSKKKSRNKR